MIQLFIHKDAKQDLIVMAKSGLQAAALQVALLFEQLKADNDLLDRLTQHGFGTQGIDDFQISR